MQQPVSSISHSTPHTMLLTQQLNGRILLPMVNKNPPYWNYINHSEEGEEQGLTDSNKFQLKIYSATNEWTKLLGNISHNHP